MHAGFIAVHLGAGKHSVKYEKSYKRLCSLACDKGSSMLAKGRSAADVACSAAAILEDSPLTNAGFGSNLSEDGQVECDAALMTSLKLTGSVRFGAVSALQHILNPIHVAREVVLYQDEPALLGRTPPCLLVGEGALRFARSRGAAEGNLTSDKACARHTRYKRRLESATEEEAAPQDTVGVICVDQHGDLASASSSGGIALKMPGRVGQVSVFGCGCWAQHSQADGRGVAVATSGCGEQLIMTHLAKTVGSTILDNPDSATNLKQVMTEHFIQSPMLDAGGAAKLAGVVVAHYDSGTVDLSMAYTTESMVLGYTSTNQSKVQVRVSRNSSSTHHSDQQRLAIEGFFIKL